MGSIPLNVGPAHGPDTVWCPAVQTLGQCQFLTVSIVCLEVDFMFKMEGIDYYMWGSQGSVFRIFGATACNVLWSGCDICAVVLPLKLAFPEAHGPAQRQSGRWGSHEAGHCRRGAALILDSGRFDWLHQSQRPQTPWIKVFTGDLYFCLCRPFSSNHCKWRNFFADNCKFWTVHCSLFFGHTCTEIAGICFSLKLILVTELSTHTISGIKAYQGSEWYQP